MIASERDLIRVARDLGANQIGGPLSHAEQALLQEVATEAAYDAEYLAAIRSSLLGGGDPLGEAFCELRDAATRRTDGAVYTPELLIEPMITWVMDQSPDRVVDAGAGSGRFVAAVVRRLPTVPVIAVDTDATATLMTRAALAVLGARHVRVVNGDYTSLDLPKVAGKTAFIGNPPYVRHHQIAPSSKEWAQSAAKELGHKISGLAGLHAYFFLATAVHGHSGDVGCFVTSSEWLDVNYGAIMRTLFLDDLGGESLHVIDPKALPFEGTQTTAVITAFRVGAKADSIRMNEVTTLDALGSIASAGQPVARARLAEASRWSGLLRTSARMPEGFVELGELCRVHRGTVTGANATWVLRQAQGLPSSVLFRSVTKARELFAAGAVLEDAEALRLVVDIPTDLDALDADERKVVDRFIRAAKKAGVHKGYIAAHRRAWWSVGLKDPAPILATYMARRPPAFVLNAAEARHINIAHGLYPRQPLNDHTLSRLAEALRSGTVLGQGRTYAGGLTKFEPKEMERLPVPDLTTLSSHDALGPTRLV